MPLAIAQDAIALLIDLAERGEIDPWDVKVIDVIDRFLTELAPLSATTQTAYEVNLSRSGQAFLYASMLVLLKADSLTQVDSAAELDQSFDQMLDEDRETETLSPLPPFLERQLRRRAVAQPIQRRQVTLHDLIDQLQTIADALTDTTSRPRRLRRPRPQSRRQAIQTIVELAHNENLTEMAVALAQFLSDQWDKLQPNQGWLDFELLLEFWTQEIAYHPSGGSPSVTGSELTTHDRVGIFWALLLLASQSKVELAQEVFYRDLKVRILRDPEQTDPKGDQAQSVTGQLL